MTSGNRRQVHVVVRGRVQGVGFRYHTLSQAKGLDLDGWVRNQSDGSVEAVVEGSPDAVETMLRWLGEGPSSARVTGVQTQDRTPTGLRGFEIRH